jgi:hypothetical protein
MRVISTVEVQTCIDRQGIDLHRLAIDILVLKKDDVLKVYYIETTDCRVYEYGTETQYEKLFYDKEGRVQRKTYLKSYVEYDAQKAQLSQIYPTELTGSEAEDYWLQMGLLYNLTVDPIYGLTGDQWMPI